MTFRYLLSVNKFAVLIAAVFLITACGVPKPFQKKEPETKPIYISGYGTAQATHSTPKKYAIR